MWCRFNAIIEKNFPELRITGTKIQEARRASVNPFRKAPRHIVLKMTKSKVREYWMQQDQRRNVSTKESPLYEQQIYLMWLWARRKWKGADPKTQWNEYLYPANLSFRFKKDLCRTSWTDNSLGKSWYFNKNEFFLKNYGW